MIIIVELKSIFFAGRNRSLKESESGAAKILLLNTATPGQTLLAPPSDVDAIESQSCSSCEMSTEATPPLMTGARHRDDASPAPKKFKKVRDTRV